MTCKLNQHWPSFWQQSVDNALSSAAATCSTDQRKLLSSELKQYTGNTHWFWQTNMMPHCAACDPFETFTQYKVYQWHTRQWVFKIKTITGFPLYLKNEIPWLSLTISEFFSLTVSDHIQNYSVTYGVFYTQKQCGLTQTGNNWTSVERCNNYNATAEKHGWYKKFSLTTSKIPWFSLTKLIPWLSRAVGTMYYNGIMIKQIL